MEPIRLELSNPPVIGTTSTGQKIRLGGFSGLRFLGRSPTGLYQFVTHTDRGPNADERVTPQGQEPARGARATMARDSAPHLWGADTGGTRGAAPAQGAELLPRAPERPFALPDFQPQLVFLDADVRLKKFFVRAQVPLTLPNGRPVRGLPPETNSEIAVDLRGRAVGQDEEGLDLEGVALAGDGTFWLCDEYGPSLVRFSTDGVLLEKLVPGRALPETLRYRRLNRGFEGIAIHGGKLYASLESPLDNPPSEGQVNSKKSRLTRIVELDLARKVTTAQFAYLLEEADHGKISDICFESPDTMLVIEKAASWIRLYRVHLAAATNLQRLSSAISGPGGTLERLSEKELTLNGVAPVRKTLQLDLTALGMREEKFEGVDRVDDKFIALLTDNDFGLAGGLDHDNALAETKDEPPALYFVPLLK